MRTLILAGLIMSLAACGGGSEESAPTTSTAPAVSSTTGATDPNTTVPSTTMAPITVAPPTTEEITTTDSTVDPSVEPTTDVSDAPAPATAAPAAAGAEIPEPGGDTALIDLDDEGRLILPTSEPEDGAPEQAALCEYALGDAADVATYFGFDESTVLFEASGYNEGDGVSGLLCGYGPAGDPNIAVIVVRQSLDDQITPDDLAPYGVRVAANDLFAYLTYNPVFSGTPLESADAEAWLAAATGRISGG